MLTGNLVKYTVFPAKKPPPPVTVTMVAGGGGILQNPLNVTDLMS